MSGEPLYQRRTRRAIRRHHAGRVRARARRIHPRMSEALCARLANNLAVCSCAMCGNPRRWFGRRTRREIMAVSEVRNG